MVRKEVSTSRQSTEREALFVLSLPRMVFWERKSAHQGSPLKEKPLPLDRDRPPESEALFVWSLPRMVFWENKSAHQGNPPKGKLYLCEVCHAWFSEKGSEHIKAIHRKRSFICVKFATNGCLRKEVSTSRQSTEREALTSGEAQTTRKTSFICVKFAKNGFLAQWHKQC